MYDWVSDYKLHCLELLFVLCVDCSIVDIEGKSKIIDSIKHCFMHVILHRHNEFLIPAQDACSIFRVK